MFRDVFHCGLKLEISQKTNSSPHFNGVAGVHSRKSTLGLILNNTGFRKHG